MVWSDRVPWNILSTCIHLLCSQMASHHFFLVLLIGLSCAFDGPSPIPGYYDLVYLLTNQTTGLNTSFFRPADPVDRETAMITPPTLPVVGPEYSNVILAWTNLLEAADPFENSTSRAGQDDGLSQTLYQFTGCFGLNNAVVSLVQLDEVTYLSQFQPFPFDNWTMVQNSRIEGTHENVCSLMYYCLFFRQSLFTIPTSISR